MVYFILDFAPHFSLRPWPGSVMPSLSYGSGSQFRFKNQIGEAECANMSSGSSCSKWT